MTWLHTVPDRFIYSDLIQVGGEWNSQKKEEKFRLKWRKQKAAAFV